MRRRSDRWVTGLVTGLVVGVLGATLGQHTVRLAFSALDGGAPVDEPGPPDHAPPPDAYAGLNAVATGQADPSGATGTGLVATKDGYTLAGVTGPTAVRSPGRLRFTITGPDGGPVRRFAPVLTKPMQVYVVRADLAEFHHLRPVQAADGTWSAPLTWARPGPYRVVAEFSAVDAREGIHHLVLGVTAVVPGRYRPVPLPGPASSSTVDGYRVALTGRAPDSYSSGSLRLHITREDEDVASIQPYLGSYVVVTCFHAGDNAVMRTMPVEAPEGPRALGGPKFTLLPVFPRPGDYRMFLEFRTSDQIRTAALTLHAP
jgi:hypothetical protein